VNDEMCFFCLHLIQASRQATRRLAAAKKLLLNKRLKYQSSLSACRSPAITRTTHLPSLLDRQRHVSHTDIHTALTPDIVLHAAHAGLMIMATRLHPQSMHATCRHHRPIIFPSPEKPALYRAWLWQAPKGQKKRDSSVSMAW
jgi:hypothetical protein